MPSISPNVNIEPSGGTSGPNSYFSASFVGSPTGLDQYDQSWANSPNTTDFDGQGITSIKLKYNQISSDTNKNFRRIHKIEIVIDGTVWRTLTFYGGDTWWRTCNYAVMKSPLLTYTTDVNNEISLGLYEGKRYLSTANPYEGSEVTLNNTPRFTSSGNKSVYMNVWYTDNSSVDHQTMVNESDWVTERVYVGTVNVKSPKAVSVSIDGGKRSFYYGETFDYSTLVVEATYQYQVSGLTAYTAQTMNYSITEAYAQSVIDSTRYASYASGTVSVTVGSAPAATYNIVAYGVSSYTKPMLKRVSVQDLIIGDTDFVEGETQYQVDDSVITYGDGTSESVSVSVSNGPGGSVGIGSKEATLSIVATKTGHTFSWSSAYTVSLLSSLIVNTDGADINFDMDDEYSSAGLVVTAVYGYTVNGQFTQAGTRAVSLDNENLSIVFPQKEVGPSKTVNVSFSDGSATASTTYQINVNGLHDMDVDISYYGDHLRVAKNGTLAYGNAVVKVRRYEDGTLSNWSSSDVPPVTVGALDTSTAGDKTVSFSVTENGVTLSADVPVTVYEISSIAVSNYPSERMYYEGTDYPTVELSKFRVVATTSDGEEIALSYNAVSNGYEVLIDGVLQSNDAITISQSTTLVVRSKTEQSKTQSITLEAYELAADETKPLVVSAVNGTLYLSVGEKVLKNYYNGNELVKNFIVQQMMNNGEYVEISDYTITISGKQTDVFDSSDDVGEYYDLVFSKIPSLSTTVENGAFLDGVQSVTNVHVTKEIYEIGDDFRTNTVTCTVNYYHASSKNGQPFRTGIDACDPLTFTSTHANAGSGTSAGKVSVPMTLYGKSVTADVYVRKVVSLTRLATGDINPNYKIHDSISPSSHNYKFQKKYNYKIDNVDTYDVADSSLSFAFGAGSATGCAANDLIPLTTTANVAVTASYAENGITVQALAFVIFVKRLKSVSIIDDDANAISEIYLDKGERLDLTPYRLHAEFNNASVENVSLGDDASATPINGAIITDKVENAKVAYTFVPGDSMEATYTIHVHYVSGITTNLSSVVGDTYYVGDTLDLSSVTASRTISSTDDQESGYPSTESFEPSFVLNSMNIGTSYQLIAAANYTLSFSDSGITKSASFTVLSVALSSIAIATTAAFKDFEDYVEGQRLDLTGLSVTKTYNNGNTATIQYSSPEVQVIDENGNAFAKTKDITLLDNDKELFAKIEENGVSKVASIGTLSVAANELDSIEILSSSTHGTSFTYGDRFSIDGMLVKANFTNGTSQSVSLANVTVTGMAIGHVLNPTDDQTFGSLAITVSYTHDGVTKTDSYNINVTKPVLSSISTNATSDAVVTQYNDGDVYSESGLIITGTFANGWTHAIPSANWSTNATSVLNVDQNTGKIGMTGNYGAKTVTVTAYNPYDSNQAGVTTTYTIDVHTSGAIVSAILVFDDDVDYANYTVGDVFDAKGAYFVVTDIDGNETNVRTFSANPAKGSILRSAQRLEVTCTYTKGTFTHTATYKILVSVPNTVSFTETNDYKLAIGKSNGDLFDTLTHEEQTIKFGKTYDSSGNVTGEFYPLFHEDKVQVDGNQAHAGTYGYNVYTGADAEGDCIGYIDLGVTASDGTVVRQAHVILFDDPLNPIDGQGNIEVTFPHYVQGLADRINRCRFGIVYNNRLFVSGNPNYKSCDWHSGAVNVSQNENYDRNADLDFTYFSDLDYCFYGTDDTAIVGYDIYRDGDLIAVKQGSTYQATLYRRSYKLIAAQTYDGSEVGGSLAEEAFPMFDVNANGGVGGLSHRSIVSFVGETLILTKDGLKAITSKENVYNSAKYSFDVSSYINPKILKENLEEAFAFPFNEKLILKTDGGVYVGYHELRNEAGEYEWYYLCDLPADLFFEHDGELYFANDDGGVYRFPSEMFCYRDMDRTFLGEGGALLEIDSENDLIIVSNAYADEIQEGRAFHLLTAYNVAGADVRSQVHATLGTFVNSDYRRNMIATGGLYDDTLYNGYIDAENDEIVICKRNADGTKDEQGTLAIQDLFYDGRKVRFDLMTPANQGELELYADYALFKVDENRYTVVDENKDRVALGGINTVRMCFVVNDLAVTYIQNVEPYGNDGAKSFNLLGDHSQTLDLVYYNNQNGYYSGVVTAENNVQSFYVTAPYSMGSISSVKTIWAWVIANDTNLASYMDVGYISSRKQGGFETIVKSSPASRKLNFDGFDFSKVSFLNDNLPHVYTKYRTLPSVNFIRFAFKNEEDTNIALTAMDVVYTVSGLSKGVK